MNYILVLAAALVFCLFLCVVAGDHLVVYQIRKRYKKELPFIIESYFDAGSFRYCLEAAIEAYKKKLISNEQLQDWIDRTFRGAKDNDRPDYVIARMKMDAWELANDANKVLIHLIYPL